jgi:hypothetical protein
MRKSPLALLFVLSVTAGLLAGCGQPQGADATNSQPQPGSTGSTGTGNAPTTTQPTLAQ